MTEKVFCYAPMVCLSSDAPIAAQVRMQLKEALQRGLSPTSFPSNTRDLAVFIDEADIEAVRRLSKDWGGMAPGRVIGGLLHALHLSKKVSTPTQASHAELPSPNTTNLRSGQARTIEEAAPLLLDGRIVFSECGTGSGKARLIAHTAALLLDARDRGVAPTIPALRGPQSSAKESPSLPPSLQMHLDEVLKTHTKRLQQLDSTPTEDGQPQETRSVRSACVVATAPSIENIGHLVQEWLRVRPVLDPKGLRRVAFRLGRGQFVNAQSIELHLQDIDPGGLEYPEVRKWLAEGMPAGMTGTSKAFLALEPGLRGLTIDLVELAMRATPQSTPMDIGACRLDEDIDDEDQDGEHYRDHLRHFKEGADLLFTTTAMLALDNVLLGTANHPGLLPSNILCLLIDEAHELETTQANLAARSLSISAVLAALTQLKSAYSDRRIKESRQRVSQLRESLSGFSDSAWVPPAAGDAKGTQDWAASLGMMRVIAEDIGTLLAQRVSTPLEASHMHAQRILRHAQSVMKRAVDQDEYSARGVITHSPVKGYVSITFGPSSVNRHLMARWSVTPCAMLLSGSLFHLTAAGSNARFAAASLAALDRMAQTRPLIPNWLTSTPDFFQPGSQVMHRFMPPSRDGATPAALRAWLESVAEVVSTAAKDAKGGMLVLMTGYQRLQILSEVLQEQGHLVDRLIIQTPHAGVTFCASQFLSLARKGRRPIWLATGSAWTGIDLSDRDAATGAQDNALTDLVIPAVPFGLERNTTHMNRLKRMGFIAEIMVTQRKLRQGLGRLVRREGLLHRRIWLLDGRLVNPATAQRFADLRVVAQQYLRKHRF
ncbi:MAG: hypothetical protein K0M67_01480 [Thiobacillus sp.]|nr:hypothetical protein [Thiobacillus sp.]